MSDAKKWLFVVFLASLVMVCNGFLSIGYEKTDFEAPYISNISAFSYELAGNDWDNPEIWVDKWFFDQSPPFKYRVLGKIPIFVTYKLLLCFDVSQLNALYCAYITWTYVFICWFLFYSGKLCRDFISNYFLPSNINKRLIFYISTLSLALSPPVLFAFKFPVHGGPNDFLAYSLISLSLLALNENNIKYFMVCAVSGIFCRETNMVTIIPFLLMQNVPPMKKWTIVALIGLIFLCYRLAWQGSYDPLGGALHNFEYPFESLLFLFMVFGPFWALGQLGYREAKSLLGPQNHFIQSVNKSYYISTIVVVLVVFSLARVREIRIEFILFFYFIPYGIFYCITNWNKWISVFKSYKFYLSLLVVAVVTFDISVKLMPKDYVDHLYLYDILGHFYGGFGKGWKVIFLSYLAVSMTVLSVILLVKIDTKLNRLRNSDASV